MPEEPSKLDNNNSSQGLEPASGAAPREPVVSDNAIVTPDHAPKPWLNQESPKNKKGLIIGGIVAAVLLVFGIGGWSAYALWYQNPEKVVTDALMNAITAKSATFTATASSKDAEQTYSFTVDGKADYEHGSSISLQVGSKPVTGGAELKLGLGIIHTTGGNNYVKVDNLQEVYPQFIDMVVEEVSEDKAAQQQAEALISVLFDPVVKKIDGEWVRFRQTDVKTFDGGLTKEFECTEGVLQNLGTQKDMQQELADRYKDNKFILIKDSLGTINGKMGFKLELDKMAAQKFNGAFKTTKLYKELEKCSPDDQNIFDISNDSFEDLPADITMALWVDQWSHQMTGITISTSGLTEGSSTHKIEVTTDFNKPIAIEAPKDWLSFQDAMPDLFDIFSGSQSVQDTAI